MTDVKARALLRTIRVLLWFTPVVVTGWLLIRNVVPSGVLIVRYTVNHQSSAFTHFASKETDFLNGHRLQFGRNIDPFFLITKNPVDLSVRLRRAYQTATVTLVYANDQGQPVIRLGAQGPRRQYTYRDLAFHEPGLANLTGWWADTPQGELVLWQKDQGRYAQHLDFQKKEKAERQALQQSFEADSQKLDEAFRSQAISQREYREQKKKLAENLAQTLDYLPRKYELTRQPELARFRSVDDFFAGITDPSRVLQYNFDLFPYLKLPAYAPAKKDTIIEQPLLGSHQLLTYVGTGGTLRVSVTAHSLNRLANQDPFSVILSDVRGTIATQRSPGLGSKAATRVASDPETISIEKSDLSEGLYTVSIKTNDDVLLTRIQSAEPVLFDDKVVLAGLSAGQTQPKPILMQTNGATVSAAIRSAEDAQTVTVATRSLAVLDTDTTYKAENLQGLSTISVPRANLVLHATGYLGFSVDAFRILPKPSPTYTPGLDVEQYDFVIARYPQAQLQKGWLIASRTFDRKEFAVVNGQANFLIDFPGLEENRRTLKLKEVQIEFRKPPITVKRVIEKARSVLSHLL